MIDNKDSNITDNNNVLTFEEIENEEYKKKPSVLKYVIALLVSILLVYAIGTFYYSSHFPHNTVINGINVGGMSPKKASKLIADNTKEYQLHINEKADVEIIRGDDIELTLDMTNEVNNLFKKINPFLWPKNLFSKKTASVMGFVNYDQELLNNQIEQLHCLEDMEAPKDAYIQYKDDKYIIIPEQEGTLIDKKELKEAIEDAISNFKTEINLVKDNLYQKPAITQNDSSIKAALDQANLYTTAKISYLPESMETTLDFNTTKDWVVMDKKMNVSLDPKKIEEYVNGLADKFNNTDGIISFTTHDGGTKEFQNDTYVYEVDKKKEAETIAANLKEGKEVSREPSYSKTGSIPNGKNIGSMYVEVSMADNHAWLYKDNYVLTESDVAIGNVDKGLFLVKDINDMKITFHDDQGFIMSNALSQYDSSQNSIATTATTEQTEETDSDDEDNDNDEDDDEEEEESTTATTQTVTQTVPVKATSDNVECKPEFYNNLKTNLKENIPVVIY